MLDDPMPGATLEAPDTFLRLAVPLWPRLPLALGYTGGARWVAFYVSADKVRYHDGASGGTGDTSLFLAYKRHPVTAPSLWGAHLGSDDEEAQHWLERYLAQSRPQPRRGAFALEAADALPRLEQRIRGLAERALEPNPFFLPEFLEPAIRAFGGK